MQLSFGDAEYNGKGKQTRREVFLAEMDQVVPWKDLLSLIAPHYPKSGHPGRQPYPLETMLRIHFLQQWYALSDPGAEEALYDTVSMRRFAKIGGLDEVPDETTILNFRRLLEQHDLARTLFNPIHAHLSRKGQSLRGGTIVDATIIAAPSSTKNKNGERDPEMHQTKKGNQSSLGMKAHIGVDDESGLVHHVECTAANAADITQAHKLLHGKEDTVCGDSGYTGPAKREEMASKRKLRYLIAEKPSKLKQIRNKRERKRAERWEHTKASLRAKVEHPFRVIKRQFGYVKVRNRGLAKNTAQVLTLFALSNLWMKPKQLMPVVGRVGL
ncbi:IS5 family transposase [Xanthomonas theicola]|uniref:IS5/IS1182 family transposase n=1 Tax=Xanthomonas theicola TaxID=56464 RepID=A0A2S6ZAG8_9XANT|nr:IS5 family transposase [Xanthomonas theicola]PPT79279.1 IS5/IS1182 family transposase [Xanthomonas theicola]QNH23549.1 IS5 family transposase [Xanthomonas theicola]